MRKQLPDPMNRMSRDAREHIRNQAKSSTALRVHIAMKLSHTAAVRRLGAPLLPRNVQVRRPTAMSRFARSVGTIADLQIAVIEKAR
jgi:hypothetical protein